MLHNEIEQSVLTAQKLALELLRKDGLNIMNETLDYEMTGNFFSNEVKESATKINVTIKFTIEV